MENDRKLLSNYLVGLSVSDFDGKIDDVIQMLANYRDTYIASGYMNIRISADQYYDTVDIDLYGDRYETDEEYEKRINMVKKIAQRQKLEKKKQAEEEKKLYERLKKKYG